MLSTWWHVGAYVVAVFKSTYLNAYSSINNELLSMNCI